MWGRGCIHIKSKRKSKVEDCTFVLTGSDGANKVSALRLTAVMGLTAGFLLASEFRNPAGEKAPMKYWVPRKPNMGALLHSLVCTP